MDDELIAAVAEAWPRAQARWSPLLHLGRPSEERNIGTVARIDLATRRVSVDWPLIREKGLADCLEAILAHEVGHHVRYPGTLVVHARMRLLERALLPFETYTVTNLFTDLMINDALRPAYEAEFVRVYRAFADELAGAWADPAFPFYLAVYEERWGRDSGSLMGPELEQRYAKEYPGYRADAQLLGQNLFALGPNVYTQFLYFVSVVSRYAPRPKEPEPAAGGPYSCGCGEPSPDDWADALTPGAREKEAVRRAKAEGWISEEAADRMTDRDARDRRVASLPGSGSADATLVPEVMAAYYRREAERYLLRPPPQMRFGEATTPTTLDDWEPGDAPRDIDWSATLLQRGPVLGAAAPLKRHRVAEAEGLEVPLWQPGVEIYLDVSGSMPDPRVTRNAMTLAAQILVTGAIRAGGRARATLYSCAPVVYKEWCRSERELSRFLMHYVGAGTEFPFGLLHDSVAECGTDQPVRVVITDHDFDHNYRSKPDHARVFAEAVRRSPQFVLMLHGTDDGWMKPYRAAGARVVPVSELDDYPGVAAALSRALFEGVRRVAD